jgi:hypothetical protein
MTSSSTYGFSLSNGEAILVAFDSIGIEPAAIIQNHMWTARNQLNLMLSRWSNLQVNLWTVVLNSIPMVDGTATYPIPPETIMILDAYITTNSGSGAAIDRYISPISRNEYAAQSNKTTKGPPTSFWFDRLINPTVTMWPVVDGTGPYTFNYYACVQIQDANIAGAETPNVPYRWLEALVTGLAARLARKYAPAMLQEMKSEAQEAWLIAAAQDTENVNISINFDMSAYR